MSVENRI